jgi:outer membrane protein OmpA-like peptidoglycan-associated protein/tetratricopeptide (TPR) repeat protein
MIPFLSIPLTRVSQALCDIAVMRKFFFLLLLVQSTLCGKAQIYSPDKINAAAFPIYEEAIRHLQEERYAEGIELLKKSIQIDSNYADALLSLAGVYGQLKKYDSSVIWYQQARSIDSNYFAPYLLPYSINLAGKGDFYSALLAVNRFMTIEGLNEKSRRSALYRRSCYQFALNYADVHHHVAYNFTPENLGDSVNSAFSEYYPTVTINDSLLVFTRREGGRENFIESAFRRKEFSRWRRIPGNLNEEPKKGAISVSQDGDWLLFAAMFPDQGYRSFDIYISYATPEGWSEPDNLGPAVNSDFWESAPTLSPDKNTLYFTSKRPDGFGGADLYFCRRLPNGSWSEAENMGPTINSAGDEESPFIHADNQTLYFTSTGWPGYGGSDLFITRKNAAGKWEIPVNLGYPINTIENEGSLSVAANGTTAYYSSDRSDSRGGMDLYRFELPKEIQPLKTFYLKGQVKDQFTGKLLPSIVELTFNNNQQTWMRVQTDVQGNYFVTLPTGKDYTLTVNRKGYLFYSELFQLSSHSPDSIYRKDIGLQPIHLGAGLTFANIQFSSNSYELPAAAKIELDKLIVLLNDNSTLRIEIGGHTDNTGNAENNRLLSENRAKAIVTYLIENEISPSRLSWKGYGSSHPIADNSSEQGKALNRRTSFTIIGI